MNFYLGTYDDNLQDSLDCISTSLDHRSNDGQIYVMRGKDFKFIADADSARETASKSLTAYRYASG